MYNNYTIELREVDKQIKATIFIGKDSLGSIWVPNNKLSKKNDFQQVLESVGNVIYGQEIKAKKEEKSYSKVLESIEAQNSKLKEDLQEKEE